MKEDFLLGDWLVQPSLGRFVFATGRASTIVTLGKDAMVGNPGLTLSPDGRWLLFAQRDRSTSDILLVEHFR